MSLPGSARSGYGTDGHGLNGNAGAGGVASRLGHRQGNVSRTSLLPSDSISQAGGPPSRGTTTTTATKVTSLLDKVMY